MRQGQNTAGKPTITVMPSAQPHYSPLFLNWGLLMQLALTEKDTLSATPIFLNTFVVSQHPIAEAQNTQTRTHTMHHLSVCECNLVLTLSLLWVSVVCCASEMKAGLSNNSKFNTSTSPLMRVPCVCSRLISAAPVGEEAR